MASLYLNHSDRSLIENNDICLIFGRAPVCDDDSRAGFLKLVARYSLTPAAGRSIERKLCYATRDVITKSPDEAGGTITPAKVFLCTRHGPSSTIARL